MAQIPAPPWHRSCPPCRSVPSPAPSGAGVAALEAARRSGARRSSAERPDPPAASRAPCTWAGVASVVPSAGAGAGLGGRDRHRAKWPPTITRARSASRTIAPDDARGAGWPGWRMLLTTSGCILYEPSDGSAVWPRDAIRPARATARVPRRRGFTRRLIRRILAGGDTRSSAPTFRAPGERPCPRSMATACSPISASSAEFGKYKTGVHRPTFSPEDVGPSGWRVPDRDRARCS